ncbi:HET-C domain-containing protein HetC [Histoplasma capsulatum]|uniref:HET-C domain-containing protein HetC n=1 Tax=Ajellomyces capsulatus TaxID=5037 RepID=A0A8A1LY09_AJECA|nr:HET-C domain-containing protein HetC [Histoplasma capsulatum]
MGSGTTFAIFILAILLVLLPSQVHAFGAGNIASISVVEGRNWRHGDIEDTVKALAFIKGHKWTGIMIKRLYFGNWVERLLPSPRCGNHIENPSRNYPDPGLDSQLHLYRIRNR